MAISAAIFSPPTDGPLAIQTEEIPWRDTGNRVGIKLRDMSFTDRARGFNIRIAVGLTTSQAFSPRHRHTFEQIRYFIDGAAKFGDVVYQPGDCVYFPESVAYGPQIGVDDVDCLHFTLQFSGPSGTYYPTPEEQDRTHAEMAATGSFIGGKYRWPDGREQDSFEALVEKMTGKHVGYAEPRYDRPIRMRTSAFAAVPSGEPGVTVRRLGAFNEVGPEIEVVEMETGATTHASAPGRTDVRFLLEGEAEYEGERYRGIGLFFFPSAHEHAAITARSRCRVLRALFGEVR